MKLFHGELRLQPTAEVPVVSEEHWDYCQISGFPSQEVLAEYLGSTLAKQLSETRRELFSDSLHVAATPLALPG